MGKNIYINKSISLYNHEVALKYRFKNTDAAAKQLAWVTHASWPGDDWRLQNDFLSKISETFGGSNGVEISQVYYASAHDIVNADLLWKVCIFFVGHIYR